MSDVALECPFEVFMGSHAIDANSCVPHAGDNVEFQVHSKIRSAASPTRH